MDHESVAALRADVASTKADIQRLDQKIDRLDHKLDQAVEQLRSEHSHTYHDLVEQIRDSETRMLSAIYSIAETTQTNFRQLRETDAGISRRVDALESRMLAAEKRLNLPPHAQT